MAHPAVLVVHWHSVGVHAIR